jgi:hypothetical protein
LKTAIQLPLERRPYYFLFISKMMLNNSTNKELELKHTPLMH